MPSRDELLFDHERLEVYREALSFIGWVTPILEGLLKASDVKDHLERASNSIVLNIAEGNGKYAPKDRCRFFDTAHGSTLECAAALDILVAKQKITGEAVRTGKERLQHIVRMLYGLIKRNSSREYERTETNPDAS